MEKNPQSGLSLGAQKLGMVCGYRTSSHFTHCLSVKFSILTLKHTRHTLLHLKAMYLFIL